MDDHIGLDVNNDYMDMNNEFLNEIEIDEVDLQNVSMKNKSVKSNVMSLQ